MAEDADRLLRQLADQFRGQSAPDEPASDPMERLARALVPPDDDIGHDESQAQLPAYVEAEMRGVNVAQRFPQLTRHLHHCDECAALHAELLELERTPPQVSHVPALDTSVIKRTWRQRVVSATAAILRALLPEQLPRLQPVADAFFLRLEQLGDQFSLQVVPQVALAAGAGETTLALRFLAATFVATQELDAQLTPEKIATLAAEGRLSPLIHRVATSAARRMKLGRYTSRFAAEYERWLMAQLPASDQS
jgi:hypothetical protein